MKEYLSVCDDSKCVARSCLILPPNIDDDQYITARTNNDTTTSSIATTTTTTTIDNGEKAKNATRSINGPPSAGAVPSAAPIIPFLLLCDGDDAWTGRVVNATTYTCCPSAYDAFSLDVLAECSTDACISPDSNGGHDCLADGFIHPMVCSSATPYRYPRKAAGNIYYPYLCCTTRAADNIAYDVALLIASCIWTVLSFITFATCLIFIIALLRNRPARSQGYNLYLVFLAAPDMLFNLCSFIRNVVNLSGSQLSRYMGGAVHALEWFHTAANLWLNALIVRQVYQMLIKSRQCTRTSPPSVNTVCRQALVIYIWASAWAGWSWVLLWRGRTIFRTVHDTAVAWIVSKTIMCGPPFLYVVTICTVVAGKKLLPAHGRTRVLSIYFLRVVIVFMLTWVPFLVLVDITYYHTFQSWMLGLAYYFASLQGLVSVTVATLGKPDIKRAVVHCIQCRGGGVMCDNDDDLDVSDGRNGSNSSIWRMMMMRNDSQRASLTFLTRHFSFSPDDGENSSSRRSSAGGDLSRRRLSVAKEEDGDDDENDDEWKKCGTRIVKTSQIVQHSISRPRTVIDDESVAVRHKEPNSTSIVRQDKIEIDDGDEGDALEIMAANRVAQPPPTTTTPQTCVEISMPTLVDDDI